MTDTPIDPATVQRCIQALRGTGQYDKEWKRLSDMDEPHLVESWTYTTHPMDILAALIKPEPTEAEKLVDEWLGGNMDEDDQDYVRLAQFILDKQADARFAEMLAAPTLDTRSFDHTNEDGDLLRTTVTTGAMKSAESLGDILHSHNQEPQFVFGPWIEWQGGDCPVPGDWMVQVALDKNAGNQGLDASAACLFRWSHFPHGGNITQYRVRFEVGKWYDWNGGPCPVDGDVKVEFVQRDNFTSSWKARELALEGWERGDCWKWTTPSSDDNIVRFKVVAP